MHIDEAMRELRACADPKRIASNERFGIAGGAQLGVTLPQLRTIAKRAGRDHALARALWRTGVHEARQRAAMVGEPDRVTSAEMNRWVREVDSWDVCDALCGDLWDRTPFASHKAAEWSLRREEYVKRAGFVLMAMLAGHDKAASDATMRRFLAPIEREACDERNFVKKAVNWALRSIGKRNLALNAAAIARAERIRAIDCRAARWVASDALRELRSDAVQRRLRAHSP